MADPDYIIDIPGLENATGHLASTGGADTPCPQGRPWISVHWKCCQAYSRIYRNRNGDAYEGRCPKCGSPVRALIGRDGTAARFFAAE